MFVGVAVHQIATGWVDGTSFVGNLVMLSAAWWLGDGARRRTEESVAHAERAALLEAAREELARRAVTEERLPIARELHDVVAHAISAIAVQAGTGRIAFEREPDLARQSFVEIESLSRDALGEMRRLLGVLRSEDASLELEPVPSLAALDRVVATTNASGVRVEVRIEGGPRLLSAGVDLAVVIEVDNEASPRPQATAPRSAGVGLVGMRERAATYAGTLEAGPMPSGGFRVVARLPRQTAVR